MALDPEDLREVDEDLLDYLHEGRLTPVYARERMIDEGVREVTSTYIGQRLQRLEEHNHVQNLYDTGLYELVDDPRDEVGLAYEPIHDHQELEPGDPLVDVYMARRVIVEEVAEDEVRMEGELRVDPDVIRTTYLKQLDHRNDSSTNA